VAATQERDSGGHYDPATDTAATSSMKLKDVASALVAIIFGVAIGYLLFAPISADALLLLLRLAPFAAIAGVGFLIGSFIGNVNDRDESFMMAGLAFVLLVGSAVFATSHVWKNVPLFPSSAGIQLWVEYLAFFFLFVASGASFNPMRRA
jgi:hypothetical protein